MRVRHYCRNRGVVVSFVKAFQLLSNCAKANCKITVNESDVGRVLADNFWPEFVSARMWLTKPQYNAAKAEAGGYDEILLE